MINKIMVKTCFIKTAGVKYTYVTKSNEFYKSNTYLNRGYSKRKHKMQIWYIRRAI